MVSNEIIEKLRIFRKSIEDRGIRVARIIVFGSAVSDRFNKDSDIDVAIISPDLGKDKYEEGVELFRLAGKIDPRLEPIPFSVQSFENDNWIPIIHEIKQSGIEI